MARGQLHLGPNGPAKCTAQTDAGCPYGGGGHYDTALEAEAAYAEKMAEEGFSATASVDRSEEIEDALDDFSSDYYQNAMQGSNGGRFDDPAGLTTVEDVKKFGAMLESDSAYFRSASPENRAEMRAAISAMEDSAVEFEEDGLEPDDSGSFVYLSARQERLIKNAAASLEESVAHRGKMSAQSLSERIQRAHEATKKNNEERVAATSEIAANVAAIQAGATSKRPRIQAPDSETDAAISEALHSGYSEEGLYLAKTQGQMKALALLGERGYANLAPGQKAAALNAASGVHLNGLKSKYGYSPTTVRELNQLKREAAEAARSKDFKKQLEVHNKIAAFEKDSAEKLERREALRVNRMKKINESIKWEDEYDYGRDDRAKMAMADSFAVAKNISEYPEGSLGWHATIEGVVKNASRGSLQTPDGLKITSRGAPPAKENEFVFFINDGRTNGTTYGTDRLFVIRKNAKSIWGAPEPYNP